METLPSELIVDILLKLPAKSLCRFKCVSKSWLALITSPRFVKAHWLAQSQRKKLILCPHPRFRRTTSLYLVDHETVYDDKLADSIRLENCEKIYLPSSDGYGVVRVYGSCNGLVCLSFNPINCCSFSLLNPSTKEYREIPNLPIEHSPTFDSHATLCGFGYAEHIDDYRLVKFCSCKKVVCIFSWRSNSWKEVEHDFVWHSASSIQGVAFDGAIHWVFDGCKIAAFDLAEEKFKTLPFPNDISYPHRDYLPQLLGGRLLLFQKGGNEFWVMKEDGAQKSWSKIWTDKSVFGLQPLCHLKNSETLLFRESFFERLLFYNPHKHKKLKRLEIVGLPLTTEFSTDVISDSLVSPEYKSGNDFPLCL